MTAVDHRPTAMVLILPAPAELLDPVFEVGQQVIVTRELPGDFTGLAVTITEVHDFREAYELVRDVVGPDGLLYDVDRGSGIAFSCTELMRPTTEADCDSPWCAHNGFQPTSQPAF